MESTNFCVYAVYGNADMTEGRGPMTFRKAFSDGNEAVKYVHGLCGVMGRRQERQREREGDRHWAVFSDYHIDLMPVYGTVEDALAGDTAAIRRQALAKLTLEERVALGL